MPFFSSTVIELNAQDSEIIGRKEYIYAGFKNVSDIDISVDRMCHDQWTQTYIVGFLPPYAACRDEIFQLLNKAFVITCAKPAIQTLFLLKLGEQLYFTGSSYTRLL